MKTNRMVAKMLLALVLVGAVTPTFAQLGGGGRITVHSVSFGSVLSSLWGNVLRAVSDLMTNPLPLPPVVAPRQRPM
jgi:hypothetical protein